jgi:hypothetical protein
VQNALMLSNGFFHVIYERFVPPAQVKLARAAIKTIATGFLKNALNS